MIKTVVLSLTFLASSVGVILLFMFDLDWGLILSYVFLAIIVLAGLAFWLIVAVVLVCCVWSFFQPHAVLKVDGHEIKIHYTRLSRGERLVLSGPNTPVIRMQVERAPITEPIEMVVGELSVNRTGDHPATLQIEGESFEFPMSESNTRWIDFRGRQSVVRSYSGYFYREQDPVHFVGVVRYAIYHELETSEIIVLNQNS